jgi:hypothetical protein
VYYRQHRKNQVGAFRYSLLSLLVASLRGRSKTAGIVGQARHFRDCHRIQLGAPSRQVLDAFVGVFEAPAATRPLRLIRGGNLKSGILRRAGQLVFALDYKERPR